MTAKSISEFYYRKDAGKHRRECKLCWIDKQREATLGITAKDYTALLKKQGGVCGICSCPEVSTRVNALAVDHCHTTGRIRGLLCQKCNLGLGHFDDSPEKLSNAVRWVEDIVSTVG